MDADTILLATTLTIVLAGVLAVGLTMLAVLRTVERLCNEVAAHNQLIDKLGDAWKAMGDSIKEAVDTQASGTAAARKAELDPKDEDVAVLTREGETAVKQTLDCSGVVAETIAGASKDGTPF